jgi:hypothetical protein
MIILIYLLCNLAAMTLGAVIYGLCYVLYRLWRPLPLAISWGLSFYTSGAFFFGAILFLPMLFLAIAGAYFMGATIPKTSDGDISEYFLTFLIFLPLEHLCFVVGLMSSGPILAHDNNLGMFYILNVVLSPAVAAWLLWWWMKRKSALYGEQDSKEVSLPAEES